MVGWNRGSRKGADATVSSSGNDLQPDVLKEGGLVFTLEKGENDSGESYRKSLFCSNV
jgi:hypothetical protein